MKNLLTICLVLASLSIFAQNQVKSNFTYTFKYCVDSKTTTAANYTLHFNATERALYLDSNASSTASRYSVQISIVNKDEVKLYTEFGVFAFQKDKGAVTHCLFVSTDLSSVLIFTNQKKNIERPVIAETGQDLRRK